MKLAKWPSTNILFNYYLHGPFEAGSIEHKNTPARLRHYTEYVISSLKVNNIVKTDTYYVTKHVILRSHWSLRSFPWNTTLRRTTVGVSQVEGDELQVDE